MATTQQRDSVSILPGVSILTMLKHIEYETWFALAEFIDNAIDSYQKHKKELKANNPDYKLVVRIELNDTENRITIRDNAAGIHKEDFPRAFRPAEVPPDRSGLSEFGMGMKSAACWFADKWSVRTTALSEMSERTVHFNIEKIYHDKISELEVHSKPAKANDHYTIIELKDVNRMPRRRGVGTVKDHLRSIYRDFIRKGVLTIFFDAQELEYTEPAILDAPKYSDPSGESVYWRADIDFAMGKGKKVKGFVAIREKASTAEAGFALFRRGRVIEGSYEDAFRPEAIFGKPNSFKYQRVFGELHLDGFGVNFTKKGVQWDEHLEEFLTILRDELSAEEFPLLRQAENYRVRATEEEYRKTNKALDQTAKDFAAKAPTAVAQTINAVRPAVKDDSDDAVLPSIEMSLQRTFDIKAHNVHWRVQLEVSYDPSLKDFIEVGNHLIKSTASPKDAITEIGIRLSLTHPFMVKYAGTDNSKIEPILRIVAALALSEAIAKSSGVKMAAEVRTNLNELINNLSTP